MTPFHAIKATVDMLLARARQPIDTRELIPAPVIARRQHSRAEPSTESHARPVRRGRRWSDSPVHRPSSLRQFWKAITEWAARRHSDTNR